MRLLLLIFVIVSLVSSVSFAQGCDQLQTNAGCGEAIQPTGPAELCVSDACQFVRYVWIGNLVIAESQLANGYAVIGWSGPCGFADRSQCPDILNQAFNDLRTNALRVNRAQGVK